MEDKTLSDSVLERVIGGIQMEYRDGVYCAQCSQCKAWIKADTQAECERRYWRHCNGECYVVVI